MCRVLDLELTSSGIDPEQLVQAVVTVGVDGPSVGSTPVRDRLDMKTFGKLLVLGFPVKSVVREMYRHAD